MPDFKLKGGADRSSLRRHEGGSFLQRQDLLKFCIIITVTLKNVLWLESEFEP